MDDQSRKHVVAPGSALPPEALYRTTAPDLFDLDEEAGAADPLIGQERAAEAVHFGIGLQAEGYNVFALGPRDTDKQRLVRLLLEERAAQDPTPSDWCYVFNFDQPDKPKALKLPPGTSTQFQADMGHFIDELQPGLTAAFESEEYHTRRRVLEEEFQAQHEQALTALQQQARDKEVALLRTPTGFLFVPMKDGEVVPPDQIKELGEAVLEQAEADIKQLQEQLLHVLVQIPARQRTLRERLRALNQEIARYVVHDLIEELNARYEGLDAVQQHLAAIEKDVVESVPGLLQSSNQASGDDGAALVRGPQHPTLLRYYVNPLVEHHDAEGAPVVYLDHPTLQNLAGRVEYRSHMGTLVTDFTLVKAGALHRANGGYLLLDARKVLLQSFTWEALKRILRAGEIHIRSPFEEMGLVSTASLDPQPIPLRVKVILFGDRWLYYLLHAVDPEFAELFHVEADFDDQMVRTPENERHYGRLMAALARQHGLRLPDRYATARLVEHAARMADDAARLSTETRALADLLREADYWAGQNDHPHLTGDDVEQALATRRRRSGRLRERVQESILREVLLIDTEGAVTGQVNGLSVLELGHERFGRPSRITASVRLGKGDVIDIEREVELGGPLHSKGVLILSSFLSARYAHETPLSLSASLVFEQSYGGIDGDSASAAELFALLSAIAEVPLQQGLAVTGSVNQHGQVQPIGGVNEKIEGFFEICSRRGLTGGQGVLIPVANVEHLMLRREVVEAVAQGQFHVYPIASIDEGMERLTGQPVGAVQPDGSYPEGTLNQRIARRLRRFAEARRQFLTETDQQSHGARTP